MRVKDTLNLGKAKFKMRGNLPVREAQWQKEWEENKLYEQRLKLNEGKPYFDLHDGPLFANGNIYMGHSLNEILKDVTARFKSMNGYCASYVPGWDTHGLPVKQQLAKRGVDRKSTDRAKCRELCRQFVEEQVKKQMTDFKRLGVVTDWDCPYITLQPKFEAEEIRVFGEIFKRGYVYKGKKSVYWSWSGEPTLAEVEVEYHDIKSPRTYVAFPIKDGKGILDSDTSLVIWTTTPQTTPSNVGVTINPKFGYVVAEVDGKKYVIGADRFSAVAEDLGQKDHKVLKTLKGTDFDRMTYRHPLHGETTGLGQYGLVMNNTYVTGDDGTDLAYNAIDFDEGDYNVGRRYGLAASGPMNAQGRLTKEVPGPDLVDMPYDDANKVMADKLEKVDALPRFSFFTHSYPHDWRAKKPVIYRATAQWFASVDKFRDQILAEIEKASFISTWGKTRLYNMTKDRGDWVISCQRAQGVPLPILYAEDDTPIVTSETIEYVVQIFKKRGPNAWYTHTAEELFPKGFKSEYSPNGKSRKETDILDVWLDSGSPWAGVMKERDGLGFPVDLYLEGSDQHRGWFNLSLVTSVAVTDKVPYKQVLSQGSVLDDKGHKMSKSLGNAISPNDVVKQMGTEIIRLWVAGADTTSDVAVSQDILCQSAKSYRKIRNTMRFVLANITDFDSKQNLIAYPDMSNVDQYMEIRLNCLIEEAVETYNKLDFDSVYKKVFSFISDDSPAFYSDFAKDALYIDPEDSETRRSMQTVVYDVLVKLTKLMIPILPYTTEEVWGYLKEPEGYAQLANMSEVEHFANEDEVLTDWNDFMKVRSDVLKTPEEARSAKVIGKSFEVHVTLYPTEEIRKLLDKLNANVRQILIASDLAISDDQAPESAEKLSTAPIVVEHAVGEVCPRCCRATTDVGSDSRFPELCACCVAIVAENFPRAEKEGLEK